MTRILYVLLQSHRGGTDTEIRVSTKSRPRRRKFFHHFCRDSNWQPFNHKSGALTTELSPPPCLGAELGGGHIKHMDSTNIYCSHHLSIQMTQLTRKLVLNHYADCIYICMYTNVKQLHPIIRLPMPSLTPHQQIAFSSHPSLPLPLVSLPIKTFSPIC